MLVVVFQRGGSDGLNMVVPFGDPNYYRIRPGIAVPRAAAVDLDGFFGLHPSLAPLKPIYAAGQLAIVHAAGSPFPIRSHLEAQDCMEFGTPGVKSTRGGWLTRALPRPRTQLSTRRAIEPVPTTPARSRYPRGKFGTSLMQIAQLIKADAGLDVASAESGGWDHHYNEAGRLPSEGQLASVLSEFGSALAAFRQDLGRHMENVTVVTMSEFGRAARENANRGTDHGHGNVMFVMGGGVRGGKVYGRWPGLGANELHSGRDLAVTTDSRDVLAELVSRKLGVQNLQQVFTGYSGGPEKFLGLV